MVTYRSTKGFQDRREVCIRLDEEIAVKWGQIARKHDLSLGRYISNLLTDMATLEKAGQDGEK